MMARSSWLASPQPTWPWLHTYMDDIDVVDIDGLIAVAEIVANTLWDLANA